MLAQILDDAAALQNDYGPVAGIENGRLLEWIPVPEHALVGLTRCVTLETASSGVTVNAICPGLVDTDMVANLCATQADPTTFRRQLEARVPAHRLLSPTEVAALALYLASDEAGGMTGQSILLDGGTLFV